MCLSRRDRFAECVKKRAKDPKSKIHFVCIAVLSNLRTFDPRLNKQW